MSLTLADIKAALRVTHDQDDGLLARLQASAVDEVLRKLDDPDLTADTLSPMANQAIVLLVQADYDGDPEKREVYARAVERLLFAARTPGIS